MSIQVIIGKGTENSKSFSISFPMEGELTEDMRKMTLEKLGKALGKQLGIQNGLVKLIEISFTTKREKE